MKQQAYIEIAEQSFAHLHTLSLQWHLKKKMGNVVRSMDRGTDAANNLITYLFLYLVPAIAECIATVREDGGFRFGDDGGVVFVVVVVVVVVDVVVLWLLLLLLFIIIVCYCFVVGWGWYSW